MRFSPANYVWWGPPRKFDKQQEDRRVSWLELFFDLVYVIAIARITHHLSAHLSLGAFLEYTALFALIFWGWLNGSLYHDLHGNEGLRTRLMTLWQMMIIAALAITLDQPGDNYVGHTIVFMVMQAFITYLWWSVGIYDKEHRYYNQPYTVLFLVALGLMGLSLAVDERWLKWIFPLVLICNYAPPFIAHRLLRRSSRDLNLSPSMFERLGLFTIIVFGELVLGVVNGISATHLPDYLTWINFALALSIVFALWWVFFTLISNREAKKGFANATMMELLYIPTVISLGLMAVCFAGFFDSHHADPAIQQVFGYAVATFLVGNSLIMGLVVYPQQVQVIIPPVRVSLAITGVVFVAIALVNPAMGTQPFQVLVLALLLIEISYINFRYYSLNIAGAVDEGSEPELGE